MNNNLIERSYKLLDIYGSGKRRVLTFDVGIGHNILPGQFYMLNYLCNQKPFSVYAYNNNLLKFMIEDRGECSSAIINSKKGDYFGLTGPLGKGFEIGKYEKFLLISGGIGVAPVLFLTNYLLKNNKKIILLIGERNNDNIIYKEDLSRLDKAIDLKIFTDDGSFGIKGFPTDKIEDILNKNKPDSVCICGPEKMMKIAIVKIKHYIKDDDIQICMERYMKCGLGICGSCVLDDVGLRVCADGPVFNHKELLNCTEFAVYHRDGNGVIQYF